MSIHQSNEDWWNDREAHERYNRRLKAILFIVLLILLPLLGVLL